MARRGQVVPLESLVLFRGEAIRQVVVNQVIFGAAHSIQDVRTFEVLVLDRSPLVLGQCAEDVPPKLSAVVFTSHRIAPHRQVAARRRRFRSRRQPSCTSAHTARGDPERAGRGCEAHSRKPRTSARDAGGCRSLPGVRRRSTPGPSSGCRREAPPGIDRSRCEAVRLRLPEQPAPTDRQSRDDRHWTGPSGVVAIPRAPAELRRAHSSARPRSRSHFPVFASAGRALSSAHSSGGQAPCQSKNFSSVARNRSYCVAASSASGPSRCSKRLKPVELSRRSSAVGRLPMRRSRDPETRILSLSRLSAANELVADAGAYSITLKSDKNPQNVSATRFR